MVGNVLAKEKVTLCSVGSGDQNGINRKKHSFKTTGVGMIMREQETQPIIKITRIYTYIGLTASRAPF